MNSLVLLQQMCVIAILVFIGIYLERRSVYDVDVCKKLSFVLMTFSNPALVLSSIINGNITATHSDLIKAIVVGTLFYAFLCLIGFIIPVFMPVRKKDRKFFNLMIVYTNVGFLGIPIARAILSENAMLYVVICVVMYNLLFYTHGISVLGGNGQKFKISSLFSAGTILSVAALFIFWFNISLPTVIADTITYVGNTTTFLSMTLLGASIARTWDPDTLKDANIWIYIVIRMIAVPILLVFILRAFGIDGEMVQAFCLMAAMPVGNLPLIQAERVGEDTGILSQGILVSTLISLITITVLMSVLF